MSPRWDGQPTNKGRQSYSASEQVNAEFRNLYLDNACVLVVKTTSEMQVASRIWSQSFLYTVFFVPLVFLLIFLFSRFSRFSRFLFSLGNIVFFEVFVRFPFQKYITSWVSLALVLYVDGWDGWDWISVRGYSMDIALRC